MRRIWDFFENMNEIVYVTDMDTYDIIYMNKLARETHGIKSGDDLKGKKCYEVLQGSSQKCSMCTNHLLKPGEFIEWKYFNPIVGRNFTLKDSMLIYEGRRLRVEIAIDITLQERQNKEIKIFTDNIMMMNEALRFSLSEPDPDKSIGTLIEYLGKALHSESVYIFEDNGHSYDNTYEWSANGIEPQKNAHQNVSYEVTKIWVERFQTHENIIIEDIEDIKDSDPDMYHFLLSQKTHSLVASPLIYNNRFLGLYGVNNPPKGHLAHISSLLEILGHFIVSLLRRRDLVKKLENLSYYDRLTGFGNRYALDECTSKTDRTKSIGIVYSDITGLKKVNDSEGHEAGDRLLVKACEVMREVFPDYPMFRIGGDEFVVFCSGIDKDTLSERLGRLRAEMDKNSIHMAFGHTWKPDCTGDIDKLLSEADELMYEDKRVYYKSHKHYTGV